MSRTFVTPLLVNDVRIGAAVVTEKDDGSFVVTNLLPDTADDQTKIQSHLSLHVEANGVSIDVPPGRVGEEEPIQ